jgi:Leucine Rich repeat
VALFSGNAVGPNNYKSMSKLELSPSSSEATAMAEVWQARQRYNAANGGDLLRELSVTRSNLTKHFVAKVFRGKAWPSLERLYLQDNSLSDDGVEMLAACVVEGWLPALHTLNLASNVVGNTGAAALAEAINHKNSCLRNIYLYDNKIGDLGAEALAQCCVATLPGNPLRHLRELFIWRNHFTEAGKDKLCRARHGGLLMWIDLTADDHTKTKDGRQKASVETFHSPSLWKSGNSTDDRRAAFYEMGHSSLQHIQSEQAKPLRTASSHFWTPRRAPRKLNQDLTESRFFDASKANNGFATTPGREEIVPPKQSSRLVMVPNPPSSANARNGRIEGAGSAGGKVISPPMRNVHRRPNLSETKSSAPRPIASAITDTEQSFRFEDLLLKAKAMDSPNRGPATRLSSPSSHPISRSDTTVKLPTGQPTKESPVSSVADSFKSPTMSTDSMINQTAPPVKKNAIKITKSSAQVSPTSPIGEYIETALCLDAQSCSSNEYSFSKATFQNLLDKARLLEQRNSTSSARKDSQLPIQKTIQVPFFVPDLEGSGLIEHRGGIASEKHADVATQSHKQQPKANSVGDDATQGSSPTVHQLRNRFEAKSTSACTY